MILFVNYNTAAWKHTKKPSIHRLVDKPQKETNIYNAILALATADREFLCSVKYAATDTLINS